MHPYKTLPPKSFWRTAVAERNFLDLSDVYKKKYEITTTDKIVTAGSCFAQHIARKLSASGFAYQDFESAPPSFPKHLNSEFGYGLFSARYGNIYTVKQLMQLFERAFENFAPAEDIWELNGRYYDPFRPAIEPNGFSSEDDFRASHQTHMSAVRRVFSESEIFIFTLGLTEAWRSRLDGSVFPICPGTSAGEFDPTRHEFHNFSFGEIIADLQLLIEKVRSVNANLRFLLTVSPVPLTATASADHVMVATSYSKSVLRAVAGEVASRDDRIDYFPSYELVAASPIRGALFEPNLRSVSPRGVDIVMGHFFEQHVPQRREQPTSDHKSVGSMPRKREKHEDDVVCEEEMLESFAT